MLSSVPCAIEQILTVCVCSVAAFPGRGDGDGGHDNDV